MMTEYEDSIAQLEEHVRSGRPLRYAILDEALRVLDQLQDGSEIPAHVVATARWTQHWLRQYIALQAFAPPNVSRAAQTAWLRRVATDACEELRVTLAEFPGCS